MPFLPPPFSRLSRSGWLLGLLLVWLVGTGTAAYAQVSISGRQIAYSGARSPNGPFTGVLEPNFRPDGGYYQTVYTRDTLLIERTRLTLNPRLLGLGERAQDSYVLTYSPTGHLRRVFTSGLHTGAYFSASASDSVGNLYVYGEFYGRITLGSFTLQTSSATAHEGLLCKLDSAGQVVWARTVGAAIGPSGIVPFTARNLTKLRVDGAGNVYVAGTFEGQTVMGGQTFQAAGFDDVLVAKFSPSGQYLWGQRYGSAGNEYFWDLCVDRAGNAYLGFDYGYMMTLGSLNLPPRGRDAAIARLDPTTGAVVWARVLNTTGTDRIYNLVASPQGSYLYVSVVSNTANSLWGTAMQANQTYLAQLAPATGAVRWCQPFALSGSTGWVVDRNGNLYAGNMTPTNLAYSYGNGVVAPAYVPPRPIVLMSSPDGLAQWFLTAPLWPLPQPGLIFNYASRLVQGPDGDIYATQSSWPLILGPDTLRSVFRDQVGVYSIWRMRAPLVTPAGSVRACPGASFPLPFTVNGSSLDAANVFTAQLSDSLGRFDTPVDVGTLTGRTSGTITVTLPPTLPPGRSYRLRVQASAPRTLLAAGDGLQVRVTARPYVQLQTLGPLSQCADATPPVLQGEAGVGTSLQWLRNGQPIPGATGASYTPTQSGSYALQASSSCGTSVSALFVYTRWPLPTVTWGPLAPVAVNQAPFALTGGTPAGGTYSGPGVSNNTFTPQTAGIGTHVLTYTYTDANGCMATATAAIQVQAVLASQVGTGTATLQVYPNPSTGLVRLRWNGGGEDVQLQLRNTTGQLVRTGRLRLAPGEQVWDCRGVPAGAYVLQVLLPQGVLTRSLILQP